MAHTSCKLYGPYVHVTTCATETVLQGRHARTRTSMCTHLIGGGLLQLNRQVHDGDVVGGHAERHACELAAQRRQHLQPWQKNQGQTKYIDK